MTFLFPGPQLCEPYEKWTGVECMLAERKMDGFRLLIHIESGEFKAAYCRDPKPVGWAPNCQHIIDELLDLGFDDCLVDGEVMGADWNDTGIVKSGFSGRTGYKPPPEAKLAEIRQKIKFHAFDWVSIPGIQYVDTRAKKPEPVFGMPLVERRKELERYLRGAELKGIVFPSEQRVVRCQLDVDELLEEWGGKPGCDGLVLKHPGSVYSFRKNKSWLKVKCHKDLDGKVIGYKEGQGKHSGMLGAIQCVDAQGGEFWVGTGFTDDERRWWWEHRDEMLGSIIECQVQDDDVADVARHASFQRIRDDKKEP